MNLSVILFIAIILQSCGTGKEFYKILDRVDKCIEEQPVKAKKLLDSLDKNTLTGKRIQARYALLYSMALDKNSIDLLSDSIISPAVDYYRNHGTPDEKLKTSYYRGRIYMNSGNYEEAMECFIQAENFADECKDLISVGRLYYAKMHIYQYLYDHESMISSGIKSADYYRQMQDTSRYLNAITAVLSGYLQLQDILNSRKYLDVLRDNYHSLTIKQKSRYYSAQLFLCQTDEMSDVSRILQDYFRDVPQAALIQWLSVADAYHKDGKYVYAEDALRKYLEYGGVKGSSYYWVNAKVQEALGNFQDALVSYKSYTDINGAKNVVLFKDDTRFLEERINSETRILKKNYTIAIVLLTLFSVILLSLIVVDHLRERHILEKQRHRVEIDNAERHRFELEIEKEKYARMYDATCKDIRRLEKTLQENKLDNEVCVLVEERLNVLNNFVAAHISGSFTKIAYVELSKLMDDHAHFMNSTRASFHIAHPKFLAYLKKSGLSNEEIEYCCLYCIGLNGSEILAYLNKPSIYNVSSALRKKLGVEKKMKIDVFLHKKMLELD